MCGALLYISDHRGDSTTLVHCHSAHSTRRPQSVLPVLVSIARAKCAPTLSPTAPLCTSRRNMRRTPAGLRVKRCLPSEHNGSRVPCLWQRDIRCVCVCNHPSCHSRDICVCLFPLLATLHACVYLCGCSLCSMFLAAIDISEDSFCVELIVLRLPPLRSYFYY